MSGLLIMVATSLECSILRRAFGRCFRLVIVRTTVSTGFLMPSVLTQRTWSGSRNTLPDGLLVMIRRLASLRSIRSLEVPSRYSGGRCRARLVASDPSACREASPAPWPHVYHSRYAVLADRATRH